MNPLTSTPLEAMLARFDQDTEKKLEPVTKAPELTVVPEPPAAPKSTAPEITPEPKARKVKAKTPAKPRTPAKTQGQIRPAPKPPIRPLAIFARLCAIPRRILSGIAGWWRRSKEEFLEEYRKP